MATLTTEEIVASLENYVAHGYVLRGFFLPEDYGWTAVVLNFDMAGCGKTPHEAIADAEQGLIHYLWMCREDGSSFEEAIRPTPSEAQGRFNEALQQFKFPMSALLRQEKLD